MVHTWPAQMLIKAYCKIKFIYVFYSRTKWSRRGWNPSLGLTILTTIYPLFLSENEKEIERETEKKYVSCMKKLENNFRSWFAPSTFGYRDQIHLPDLHSKHLYLLSHPLDLISQGSEIKTEDSGNKCESWNFKRQPPIAKQDSQWDDKDTNPPTKLLTPNLPCQMHGQRRSRDWRNGQQ
jgi:hypothetical protein